jgi:hypothetical protein
MRSMRWISVATLVLSLAACKGSIEGQRARYQQVKDRLDAYAAKNPTMKADIQAKVAEFDGEEKSAEAKGGDEGINAISRLVTRMEAYEKAIGPAAAPTPTSSAPGAKLGGPATPPPPPGGNPSGFGQAPPPPPGGNPSGFGQAPPPANPAQVPPPPPPGGNASGFGGPAPASQANPSGFGGK